VAKETDIWMPVNIGDYLKDTQHLDAQRHGCYLLWLMHYWIRGPLPNSMEQLILIGKLGGVDAPSIAHALLTEFFKLETDGLYHQKRADAEKARWIAKTQLAKEKAADAAQARWKLRAPSITPSTQKEMLGVMHKQCPSPSSKDNTKSLVNGVDASAGLKIRPEEFGNAWNRNAGKILPKIKDFTESRRNKTIKRIKEGLTLERFVEAVKLCTQKPFLRGEGSRHWKARFDWLMQNDRNITRVFEEDWSVDHPHIVESEEELDIPRKPVARAVS
jgi:uncharacterized protein YdaU (DUF1376 family)